MSKDIEERLATLPSPPAGLPSSRTHNVDASATHRPLRILSLDGGGIRGLASLFFLQDLMGRIKVREALAEMPLPCEWFDLIVGTSTGGLIALMLGRLRLAVNAAIDAYKGLAKEVFGEETMSWVNRANPVSSEDRYSAEKLEAAIRKIITDFNLPEDEKLADPEDPQPKCRVAVVAVRQRAADGLPDLLRTYTKDKPPYICTIVDAAKATSAATTFFPPTEVEINHGLEVTYVDGGLGYNNPTGLALDEAAHIWGADRSLGCIVSIGTGISPYVNVKGNEEMLASKLLQISTSCRAMHQGIKRRFRGTRGVYFRFDPATDLASIRLNEWDKLKVVVELAHAYLEEEETTVADCVNAITHPAVQDIFALQTAVEKANQQEVAITPKAIPSLAHPFYGRQNEVDDIVHLLLSSKGIRVAILGTGGIGKTAVATAVLHHRRVEEAFGKFRFFIPCDSATATSQEKKPSGTSVADAAGQLISIIATNLQLDVSRGHADDIVVRFFSRQHSILVLDNLETLWDKSGSDFDQLFQRLFELPKLDLVVTMRGTATPWGTWYEKVLLPLDAEPARKVFSDLSEDVNLRGDTLDRILVAVEWLPLAIVLLAKQAKGQPDLEHLWEQWQRRRTAMVKDKRYRHGKSDERLLNLEASIQLSLDRPLMKYNPPARTLLSLLSLLPDGASWDDLEALVPSSSLCREDDRPEMVLLQLSLAYIGSVPCQSSDRGNSPRGESEPPSARLRVLAPIREYVQHKHAPETKACQRLMSHYLDIATGVVTDTLMRFRPEIHNLEAVTVRALSDESEQERAVHSAGALCNFLEISGIALPALTQGLREILSALRNKALAALVQHTLGRMALRQYDSLEASKWFNRALRLYRVVGDFRGQANCIHSLGYVSLVRSKYSEARGRFADALPLYEYVSDSRGKASCTHSLGRVALHEENYDEARAKFDEALPLLKEVNDRLGMAECIHGLGRVAFHDSMYGSARARFEEAPQVCAEALVKAACIRSLGDIAFVLLRYNEARTRWEEALPIYEEISHIRGKANCLQNLGDVASVQLKYPEARGRYEEALRLYQKVNDSQGEARCRYGLGMFAEQQRNYGQARAGYEEALRLFRKVKDRQGEANCLYSLAMIAGKQLNYCEAYERFREAREVPGASPCVNVRSAQKKIRGGTAVTRFLARVRDEELVADTDTCWDSIGPPGTSINPGEYLSREYLFRA